MANQKIVPHFWFDREAVEAANFYVAAFGGQSRILDVNVIEDTPSGSAEFVNFEILGYEFMAISAGPLFRINPSISFHVRCREVGEVDAIWERLVPGGTILMELGEYPFSKRFGWVQDKFGVTWQVIHSEGEDFQRIMPFLMFTKDVCGKAEEAIHSYATLFPDSRASVSSRYGSDEAPDKEGTVRYGEMILEGQEFAVMDSAHSHDFTFNEAVSLVVNCDGQEEIDYYWDRLSAVPEAEQCGWIKDRFGVSWQIIPANMGELMGRNPEKTTPAMLAMKKIVIADLEKAGTA